MGQVKEKSIEENGGKINMRIPKFGFRIDGVFGQLDEACGHCNHGEEHVGARFIKQACI